MELSPNKKWLEEHVGKKLRLEWPDKTYVVTIERGDGDD